MVSLWPEGALGGIGGQGFVGVGDKGPDLRQDDLLYFPPLFFSGQIERHAFLSVERCFCGV